MSTVLITGNTYPVRVEMRALGGTWNKRAQGWDVPEDKAEAARVIVAAAPPTPPRGPWAGRRGAEVYRNPRGRCEDAPCCGCCS